MPAAAGRIATPTIAICVTAPDKTAEYASLRRREHELVGELADVRQSIAQCKVSCPLTSRQIEFVLALGDHLEEHHGQPPSVRELAARMGIVSPNGVQAHILALRRLGLLAPAPARERRSSRGTLLSPLGWQVYRAQRGISDRGSAIEIPIGHS